MATQPFPATGGIRFKHGPWIIGIFMDASSSIGDQPVMGHEAPNGEFEITATLHGIEEAGWWDATYAANGGQGAYWMNFIVPVANAKLPLIYSLQPPLPDETNATPYTLEDTNIMIFEWIKPKLDPTGQFPVLVQRDVENKTLPDLTKPIT